MGGHDAALRETRDAEVAVHRAVVVADTAPAGEPVRTGRHPAGLAIFGVGSAANDESISHRMPLRSVATAANRLHRSVLLNTSERPWPSMSRTPREDAIGRYASPRPHAC